ncbi:MAG: tetratricopeptide repeat protein [Chloroflexi bacterium]|nr:tetratricopeptide repeat protein [Chloroflexota bacterium]
MHHTKTASVDKFPRWTAAVCACVLCGCAAAPATPSLQATILASTPNATAVKRAEAAATAIGAQDYARAITQAQAAVDADPNASMAWYQLGNAHSYAASVAADVQQRDSYYTEAIRAYERAAELNTTDGAILHNLGTAYLQNGRLTDAQKAFERALTIDPADPKTLYMLGTIYLLETAQNTPQANQRAREKFEQALQSDPGLAVAYIGLAQVYINEGDAGHALDNARRGVELSGNQVDPFSYWQLAQAQCAMKDAKGGAETLQRILAANVPNDAFNQQVRSLLNTCK